MDAHSFNDVEMVQGQGVETPIGAEVDAADSTVTSELQKKEELENVKRRLKEIEEEASNLRAKFGIEKPEEGGQDLAAGTVTPTLAEKEEADSRSIFVGNVDYECTPEEVQHHFHFCGTVNRVTIVNDGFGHPKGFAYVEFAESEAVQNALALHETELHGRPIKVFPKRTNLPGITQNRERRVSRRILNPGPPMFSSYSYGRYPRSRPSMRYNPY